MKRETGIQDAILQALAWRPDVVCWRMNVGQAMYGDAEKGQRERRVRFGLKGQADISGIVRGTGRRLEIEVKTEDGAQSPEQRAYQQRIEECGGIYLLVRSVEDCMAQLDAAIGYPPGRGPGPRVGPRKAA